MTLMGFQRTKGKEYVNVWNMICSHRTFQVHSYSTLENDDAAEENNSIY